MSDEWKEKLANLSPEKRKEITDNLERLIELTIKKVDLLNQMLKGFGGRSPEADIVVEALRIDAIRRERRRIVGGRYVRY